MTQQRIGVGAWPTNTFIARAGDAGMAGSSFPSMPTLIPRTITSSSMLSRRHQVSRQVRGLRLRRHLCCCRCTQTRWKSGVCENPRWAGKDGSRHSPGTRQPTTITSPYERRYQRERQRHFQRAQQTNEACFFRISCSSTIDEALKLATRLGPKVHCRWVPAPMMNFRLVVLSI